MAMSPHLKSHSKEEQRRRMFDITLVHPRSPFLINEAVFPPLSLMYLSASLKTMGFTVQCLAFALGHTIADIESDIVGISFTSAQKEEAFHIAKLLKGKTLIAGGAHPTHMPKECLTFFDYVI